MSLSSQIVDQAIQEMNESGEYTIQLNNDAVLFGAQSTLDSMGLVNLITIIEEKIEEKTGDYLSIADENAMSLAESPFKTVGTLKKYIFSLLENK